MKCILLSIASFIAGAIITFIITRDGGLAQITCPKFDYSAEPPFKRITPSTAKALVDTYAAWQSRPTIVMPDGKADARSVNFTLSSLKKFIWDMEKKTCDIPALQNLGIRFYYGRYPNLNATHPEDLDPVNTEFSFRHTLFLVPTYRYNGLDIDFDPEKVGSSFNPAESKTRELEGIMYLMNHGNICPPPFPANDAPQDTGMKF